RAWLDWVEEYISPKIEMDASYFYK
ncbi:hypothetical protein ABTD71_25675, partial [Acinetobacter baumannii]